jgi:hypothetical protein
VHIYGYFWYAAVTKMLEPEAIGLGTEIKLQIIREYAAAYTTILKSNHGDIFRKWGNA